MAFTSLVVAGARARALDVYHHDLDSSDGDEISDAIAASLDNLRTAFAPKLINFKGRQVFVRFTLDSKRQRVEADRKSSDCFQYLPAGLIRACCDFFMPSYGIVMEDFNAIIAVKIPYIKKNDSFHTALTTGKVENCPTQLATWLRFPSKNIHTESGAKWRKEIQHLPGFDPSALVQFALVCRSWNRALKLVPAARQIRISQPFITETIQSLRWQVFFNCLIQLSPIKPKRLKEIFYKLLKSGRSELVNDFLCHLQKFSTSRIFVYIFAQSKTRPSAFSYLLGYKVRERIGHSFHADANIKFLFAFIVKNKLYLNPRIFDPLTFYQDYGDDEIRKNLDPVLIAVHVEKDREAKQFFLTLLEKRDPDLHNIVYHAVLSYDHAFLARLFGLFPESAKALVHHKDVRSIIKNKQTPEYYVEMDKCYCILYKYNVLRTDPHPTFQSFLDNDLLPELKSIMPRMKKHAPGRSDDPKKLGPAPQPLDVSDEDSDVQIISHRRDAKKSYLRQRTIVAAAAAPAAGPDLIVLESAAPRAAAAAAPAIFRLASVAAPLAAAAPATFRPASAASRIAAAAAPAAAAFRPPSAAAGEVLRPVFTRGRHSSTFEDRFIRSPAIPPPEIFPLFSDVLHNLQLYMRSAALHTDLGIEPLPLSAFSSFADPSDSVAYSPQRVPERL